MKLLLLLILTLSLYLSINARLFKVSLTKFESTRKKLLRLNNSDKYEKPFKTPPVPELLSNYLGKIMFKKLA